MSFPSSFRTHTHTPYDLTFCPLKLATKYYWRVLRNISHSAMYPSLYWAYSLWWAVHLRWRLCTYRPNMHKTGPIGVLSATTSTWNRKLDFKSREKNNNRLSNRHLLISFVENFLGYVPIRTDWRLKYAHASKIQKTTDVITYHNNKFDPDCWVSCLLPGCSFQRERLIFSPLQIAYCWRSLLSNLQMLTFFPLNRKLLLWWIMCFLKLIAGEDCGAWT